MNFFVRAMVLTAGFAGVLFGAQPAARVADVAQADARQESSVAESVECEHGLPGYVMERMFQGLKPLATNARPPGEEKPSVSTAAPHCVGGSRWSACFAPGTTPEQMAAAVARLRQRLGHAAYVASSRWTTTSTNGGTPSGPVTLTYSFVPDVNTGDPDTSNNLHAALDGQFGSRAAWQNIFRDMFERWSEHAGVTFVETSDDGAAWPTSPGAVGLRGDIRIVAQPIDGLYGTLAYNYFPNFGDMTLDSGENWADATSNYRFMRNTLMHELGHGLGLDHVSPTDGTKLMEPFLNTAFLGPQDDDARGAQRHYGDRHEPNASAAAADDLGAAVSAEVADGSLHRSTDVDWYQVQANAGASVEAIVTPEGDSYSVGPDGGSPQPVDTASAQRLRVRAYAPGGTTLLAEESAASAGDEVSAVAVVPGGQSSLLIQVSSAGGSDDVQRYSMSFVTGAGSSVQLSVSAEASAPVVIIASPADQGGNTNVPVPGTLTYSTSQTVTLTAPATAGSERFIRWRLDGVPQLLGQASLVVSMSAARAAHAQYSNGIVAEISGPAQIVQGQSATLTAAAVGGQPPYQFAWSPNASLSNPTGASTSAAPSSTTAYSVTATDALGATGSAVFTLNVVPPLSVNAGPDRIVAVGSSFTMQAAAAGGAPPYAYQWSPATNLTSTTDPLTQVNALVGRTYTLSVTDQSGAGASDTMVLAVAPALRVSLPAEVAVVSGRAVTLEPGVSGGAAPYQYEWRTAGAVVGAAQSLSVTTASGGSYEVRVSDASGQSAAASVQVIVSAALQVQARASRSSVRTGEAVQLNGVVSGGRAPYAVAWSPAQFVSAPTGLSTSANPFESTVFVLLVTDTDGQAASASVNVSVDGLVTAQGTSDDGLSPVVAPIAGPCGLTSIASCALLMLGIASTRRRG